MSQFFNKKITRESVIGKNPIEAINETEKWHLCKCGHARIVHTEYTKGCKAHDIEVGSNPYMRSDVNIVRRCKCPVFRPTGKYYKPKDPQMA